MFNPEQALMRKMETREDLTPAEQALLGWYVEKPEIVLEKTEEQQRKNMRGFEEVYDRGEIEGDIRRLSIARKGERQVEATKRGQIFEAIVAASELSEWFGDSVSIAKTSEFDDRFNHADLVFEWKHDDGEVARLAVDCTVSVDDDRISAKLRRIAQELEGGDLTTIKYFSGSDDEAKKEKLTQIPRVILCITPDELTELCDKIVGITATSEKEKRKEGNQNFNKHSLQFYLLEEALLQLEKQQEKIKQLQKTKKLEKATKNIAFVLKILNRIKKKKESSLDSLRTKRAIREAQERITRLVEASLRLR